MIAENHTMTQQKVKYSEKPTHILWKRARD